MFYGSVPEFDFLLTTFFFSCTLSACHSVCGVAPAVFLIARVSVSSLELLLCSSRADFLASLFDGILPKFTSVLLFSISSDLLGIGCSGYCLPQCQVPAILNLQLCCLGFQSSPAWPSESLPVPLWYKMRVKMFPKIQSSLPQDLD